ncbi:MAG: type II toxin-antitoxin system RelE/ParE family toxin [Verrucomicrobiia bacterium]
MSSPEAAAFYESQRPGLGATFTIEVEATIQRILQTPEKWRCLEQDVRTCRVRTFPYAILYTLQADSVLILAVMHLRREPGCGAGSVILVVRPKERRCSAPGGGLLSRHEHSPVRLLARWPVLARLS